jgi:hypothetical protein
VSLQDCPNSLVCDYINQQSATGYQIRFGSSFPRILSRSRISAVVR